uniref:Uncharacterized protein n=1 Tax=Knipowitschia caucasica TaxID=637954 RepID=A0AAV2IVP6_KNICA
MVGAELASMWWCTVTPPTPPSVILQRVRHYQTLRCSLAGADDWPRGAPSPPDVPSTAALLGHPPLRAFSLHILPSSPRTGRPWRWRWGGTTPTTVTPPTPFLGPTWDYASNYCCEFVE